MSYKIHNVRFYNLEPKSVTCFSYEILSQRLALARLVSDNLLNYTYDVYNIPNAFNLII
jgi:U3 small nucleolar RNA-associated protein 4